MSTFQSYSNIPDANVVFFPFALEDTTPFREGDQAESQSLNLDPANGISAKKDIIQLKTSKPKGGVGNWSCLLGSRINWKGVLHAGCWCMIYISNVPLTGKETAEKDSGLKMLGIVRSVRRLESLDPQTGIRAVRFLISGNDFHSVFETPIYLNVNLSDIAQNGNDLSIANALVVLNSQFGNTLTPDEMVKLLVDSLLGKPALNAGKSGSSVSKLAFLSRGGQPYKVPKIVAQLILGNASGNVFFTEMVTFFLQSPLVGITRLQSDIGRLVSTWSLIQTFCHRILNEVYTELLPVNVGSSTRLTPSIVLRAIPFSSDKSIHNTLISMQDAKALILLNRKQNVAQNGSRTGDIPAGTGAHFFISKSIYESEILEFSSGKTDSERFNLFFVPPNLSLLNDQQKNEAAFLSNIINIAGGQFGNVGDISSISRYGLRPYIAYSDYCIADSNKTIGTTNLIVQDLWATAHLFENGQVTIPGNLSHIPVGTNIEFIDRGWVAHIEQVDHSFDVNPGNGAKSFRTTLTFVRLQNSDGTPIDSVENSKKQGLETTNENGVINDTWDRGMSSK